MKRTFAKFLPEHFVDYVVRMYLESNVRFSIVKSRTTKLGDFRGGLKGQKPQITVNGDLNPYSFLVTTLHEFAHLNTFNTYGTRVSPHGEEWKNEFKKLLLPVIQSGELPVDVERALVKSYNKVKASSCSDYHLSKTLLQYDQLAENTLILESLPKDEQFSLNGKVYEKGILRRKRYVCREVQSNRLYLISALAKVSKKED
ncbi:MAG: sprT domain-containing protein [Bacteroidota bacterium]